MDVAMLVSCLNLQGYSTSPAPSSRGTACPLANADPHALEVTVSEVRAEVLPTVYFLHAPNSQVL